MPLA
ncbi:02f63e0b-256d-4ed2-8632-090d2b52e72b [Thermothielavioides terrestris]|jgi:hypothetical protein